MKKEVQLKEHIVQIICGNEFAILQKRPNGDGIQGITFSIPATSVMADRLENSKIVEVESVSESGNLTFKRLPFYETHLMIELITDILERYELEQYP